jgi:hypothetical protein
MVQLAGTAAQFAANLTIDQLRQHTTLLLDILQTNLGLTPAFLEQQLWATVDDLIGRLSQLPAGLSAEGRATRLAVASFLRRLKRLLYGRFHWPTLNADQIAGELLKLLRRFGWDLFAEKAGCIATNFQNALTAASPLAELIPGNGFGPNSVGAAQAVRLLAAGRSVDRQG